MSLVHDRVARLDLNLLRPLHVLLEHRSVTAAARELGLTQSAMSRSLARLREIFDDPLLVRVGRQLEPTARARALEPEVERLLSAIARLLEQAATLDPRQARGTLRISSADLAQLVLAPRIAQVVSERAPHVDLHWLPASNNAESLESGALDFNLAVDGSLQHASLVKTPIYEDSFVCILRRGHPALRRKLTLTRYEKLEHVLAAPGGRTGGIVDRELAALGKARRVAVAVSSFAVVPSLVASSDRIATVPRSLAEEARQRYELAVVPPPLALPGFRLCLFWLEHRRAEPLHAWFRKLCQELAERRFNSLVD